MEDISDSWEDEEALDKIVTTFAQIQEEETKRAMKEEEKEKLRAEKAQRDLQKIREEEEARILAEKKKEVWGILAEEVAFSMGMEDSTDIHNGFLYISNKKGIKKPGYGDDKLLLRDLFKEAAVKCVNAKNWDKFQQYVKDGYSKKYKEYELHIQVINSNAKLSRDWSPLPSGNLMVPWNVIIHNIICLEKLTQNLYEHHIELRDLKDFKAAIKTDESKRLRGANARW
jgi:hypothetical protein